MANGACVSAAEPSLVRDHGPQGRLPVMPRDDSSKEHLIAAIAERDRLLKELESRHAELEAQNRALREAQGQLEATRGRYADLYDFAPVAYFTLGEDTSILEANVAAASLMGRERSGIIGKPLGSFVRLDDPSAFE